MSSKVGNEHLGTDELIPLMTKMAIPSILAQTVNILYSIIDRVYIGHIKGIGTDALTGVGLTLPIITLISAFSAVVGAGGAPLAAIFLGKRDGKRANQILGNGIFLLCVFTVVLMLVFYLFQKPLLYAFGASDNTIVHARLYLSVYLIGTLMVQLALGLNPFILCEGNAKIGMLTVCVGAVINLVLDPIFIFVFDLKVAGAAIATVISQTVSAIWILLYLTGNKTTFTIQLRYIKPDWDTIKRICGLGISPFIMRSTESLISIVMNRGLQMYGGDMYVGSLTIMQSIYQFLHAPISGFTQGVQPIISYNYGAGKFERVRKTSRYMIITSEIYGLVATIVVIAFPTFWGSLFTPDVALIALIRRTIPIFFAGTLVFGLQLSIQPVFLATGQAKVSLFIALLRKVILLVPLAIILPHFMGVWGIYYAEPISDILSVVTACTLYLTRINKILSKESLEKIV